MGYFKHEYHKWKSYVVSFLRHGARQTGFFLILDHFLPFYTSPPLNNPENQNFEKMEKIPGDIILQKCTINDNHMIYGSWDMKCTRENFFLSSWAIFYHPPNSLKNKNFKKVKKVPKMCTNNHDHRLYCCWDMARDGCNCYFSFWVVFCPFTLLTAQKMKISKKWKKHL